MDELAPLADRWEVFAAACRRQDFATIDQLLAEAEASGSVKEVGRLLDFKSSQGMTVLLTSCRDGHLGVVSRLMAARADIETTSRIEARPLWLASRHGYLGVVEMLLAAGAHTEAPNQVRTPLFMACLSGHLAVVEKLLTAGVQH